MPKTIVISVISALITAMVLWFVGIVHEMIPTTISIPSGAVVAFDEKDCPKGWEEYKAAYGRFVRGVDKSGKNIDPEGERVPGTSQEDMFKSHNHREHPSKGSNWFSNYQRSGGTWPSERSGNTGKDGPRTGFEGGEETRPKNIALLFCEKL